MQQAILYHMNHEESQERDARESRYRASQDDIKVMRTELNKLSGNVGELVVAIRGNDMGTVGMVGQIKELREKIKEFEHRLDKTEDATREAKLEASKRQFYWGVIWTLAGVIIGSFMKYLADRIIPIKK